MAIQNYFVQVTIQSGKIVENEDGTTEKIVDSVEMDDLFCSSSEQEVSSLIKTVQSESQKLA